MQFRKACKALFALSFCVSTAVHAEGDPLVFMDVFGGYSWSQDQDVKISTILSGAPGSLKLGGLDVHNGPAFGGRIGAWLITHPSFGIAIDVTRFDTDIDNQTSLARVTSSTVPLTASPFGTGDIRIANTFVSFDLMLRHQGERFTPYMMAGPGIMFANMDNGFLLSVRKQDSDDKAFGFKVGGGISYKISDNMHLFTEYRYIHSATDYDLEDSVDPVLLPTLVRVNADVEIDVDAHLVVGGLSIRF